MPTLSISVILTVYNEAASIGALMASLVRQTRPADEVVVVDGGSTDGTVAVLQSFTDQLPLHVIVEPGANISRGRNRAFAESRGDIIAITDAGVVLPDHWLAALLPPFDDPETGVVAGFFQADPHTVFEAAMGATVLPAVQDIDPARFLPSSRSVAVRRAAFAEAGGYPEWLDYCEDLIFDLRLKQQQRFAFAPHACVAFQPRGTLDAFYRQYFRYSRGDGKADLWRKRHIIRYATYHTGLLLLLLALRISPWYLAVLVLGGLAYVAGPYRRLPSTMQALSKKRRVTTLDWLRALGFIPLLRITGDIAKMHGYPVGVWWRLRNRPPDWRTRVP